MTHLNYSQKTNFEAGCTKLPGLRFYLQSLQLPGVSFSHYQSYGQGMLSNVTGDSPKHEELSIEVLIDEDYEIYFEFMKVIQENVHFTSGSFADVMFDFWVTVYNNKGHILFTEFFRNCRITNVSSIQLETTDDMPTNTFTLGLLFDWFEIRKEGLTAQEMRDFNIYPEDLKNPEDYDTPDSGDDSEDDKENGDNSDLKDVIVEIGPGEAGDCLMSSDLYPGADETREPQTVAYRQCKKCNSSVLGYVHGHACDCFEAPEEDLTGPCQGIQSNMVKLND